MTHLIVLPHGDPTLRYEAPGHRTAELHRAAVDRLTSAAQRQWLRGVLRTEAEAAAGSGTGDLALLEAADRFLSEPPRAPDVDGTGVPDGAATSRLLAVDVVLTLAGPRAGWPVTLRLDDLELVHGTTQSTADVARAAAAGGTPFVPELLQARALLDDGPAVLFVDRDQQLPALFALVAQGPARPLFLDGPFARRHWPVLRRHLPPGSGLRRTHALARAEGRPEAWLTRPDDGPWADQLTGAELAALAAGAAAPAGCAAAVVTLAAATAEGVLTADGTALSAGQLASAVRQLAGAAVRVLAELWLGAPGVDETQLRATAAWLAAADLPWQVAGCRPFHLPGPRRPGADGPDGPEHDRRQGEPTWAGHPAPVRPAPPELDLPRGALLDGPTRTELLPELLAVLAARHTPVPGRVAGAYLAEPGTPEPEDRLVPGATVVMLGAHTVLADLRTRRTYALDPRLGGRLARLGPGQPVSAVLPQGRALERTVALLSSIGVLSGKVSHA
ncbi:hypothetical protein ACFCV9_08300 [Streptomyces sp. NPDC056367]|uniref:hypothetical protein n=1 Tax=Streptomyces sp. NPDC056367 TaxID=3345797 RepID=UPI0035E2E926